MQKKALETPGRLIVDVARLDDGGERYAGETAADVLDLDSEFITPLGGIVYDLNVQALGTELLVRGTLCQRIQCVCSRCATDFEMTVKENAFVTSIEINDETEFVDLTDDVRECIILNLPSYPICRVDCKGLCMMCGTNLNTGTCTCHEEQQDNRWAALDAVLK